MYPVILFVAALFFLGVSMEWFRFMMHAVSISGYFCHLLYFKSQQYSEPKLEIIWDKSI